MSIIENAISKVQRKAGGPSPMVRPRAREVVRAPDTSPAGIAAAARARKFKEASIDAKAMERHCVLPQIIDERALRAYKMLRTRVLQRMVGNNWYSIAVTGSTAGEGKSLTAINLAIALAQDVNTWVFLVDLDLQRPQVASYLGLEFGRGLSDYLTGEANIDEIFYNPKGMDRLTVIPNSRSIANSSELLVSPRMIELAKSLLDEAPRRIVIYDMPPLLASDDMLAFAPQVDGLLVVLAEGISVRANLQKVKQLIGSTNVIGVVLNQSSEPNDSPYY
jgi:protein-tyrosine kinase